MLCRSLMLKSCFTEFLRTFATSPSRTTRRKAGVSRRWIEPHPRFSGATLPVPWRRTPQAGMRETPMAVSMTAPILIVDDYNTMIRILRNLLRQLGFSNIDEASDGRTALTKMKSKDYALVISDWNMAPMTGAELLQRVRADERTRATPFVMVANDMSEATRAAERDGAACIAKPFNAVALKTKLEAVLGAF